MNTEIKNKIINHLIKNGKKNKSEKILLKSIKELQKISAKPTNKLIQLALVFTTPIFKINTIKKKGKKKKLKSQAIPTFISNKKLKTSFAIKFITSTAKLQKSNIFAKKLQEEILTTSQNKGATIKAKNQIQKQALTNRHLFQYYRWHN